jgi:hypothetical protein
MLRMAIIGKIKRMKYELLAFYEQLGQLLSEEQHTQLVPIRVEQDTTPRKR